MKKVFIYALSTCPWCKKTKKFFQERNIPFDYIDCDLLEEEEQEKTFHKMLEICGSTATPVVLIGDEVIVGYHPDRFLEALGLA